MALTPGQVFQTVLMPIGVTLSATAPTGGVGPFIYQWYRDYWYGFVPGPTNILTGQTALVMQDTGLDENSIYFYVLVATDTGNGNLTVNYTPFGVLTPPDMAGVNFQNPSCQQFKWRFDIDFPYGTATNTVRDQDILRAMRLANSNFNWGVWNNQGEYGEAYLNLSAHHLVGIRQAASQGINAEYEFPHASKGGLGVSVSQMIPQPIQEGPLQAALVKTPYGKIYWEMVRPRVIGTFYELKNHVSSV